MELQDLRTSCEFPQFGDGFALGFFLEELLHTTMAMNFSILRITVDETWFYLWMSKQKSSQSSGCPHIHQKPRRFKQTLFARKLMAASFP
jgi:hypothetical protein